MDYKVERKNDRLFHVLGKTGVVAIELGPKRLKVRASDENLSDSMTARHYHAPKTKDVIGKDGKPHKETVYAKDALGKPIEVGKDMTVLDWKGTMSKPVWYIYLKVGDKFVPKGECEIKEDALVKAFDLLSKESA